MLRFDACVFIMLTCFFFLLIRRGLFLRLRLCRSSSRFVSLICALFIFVARCLRFSSVPSFLVKCLFLLSSPSLFLSVCLSVFLSFSLSVCLSVCLSVTCVFSFPCFSYCLRVCVFMFCIHVCVSLLFLPSLVLFVVSSHSQMCSNVFLFLVFSAFLLIGCHSLLSNYFL